MPPQARGVEPDQVIGVGTMGAVGAMAPPDFTRGGPGPHRCLALAHLCNL